MEALLLRASAQMDRTMAEIVGNGIRLVNLRSGADQHRSIFTWIGDLLDAPVVFRDALVQRFDFPATMDPGYPATGGSVLP
jgi:hypothetical protein